MPRGIDVERAIPAPAGNFGLGGKKPVGLETRPPSEGRPASDASETAPDESRAVPPPGASAANLPPIAAKDDDLEAIKKAVEDAASVSGTLWFSYLFVLFYFAVAAGAVTHADLFLENPVKLPFLGVDLPLLASSFSRRSYSSSSMLTFSCIS
jgi:hypothetical protein